MKKIKQMRIKAILLTIVAVLTLGFTSCTDELASDQTQGKPGYLTINVKTLKPKQTKVGGAAGTDYQIIKNLNVFVFNAAGNKIIHNYEAAPTVAAGSTDLSIPVSVLPAGSMVVVVANYGATLGAVTTKAGLESTEITTIRDFATNGLHMTGQSTILTETNGSYTAQVKIAPVEAKITVQWTLSTYISDNYDITGVYVVNAIGKTQLPIIRNNSFTGILWDASASNILPSNFINYPAAKTAATGLAGVAARDFNFYTTMPLDATNLADEGAALTGSFHYYVGENYYNNATIVPGAGALVANSINANTLVVIKATPKAGVAAADIIAMGPRYYTYEFTNATAPALNADPLIVSPAEIATTGFSVRRKTNYNLTFTLNSIGSTNPYERSRMLNVTVTADPWDDAPTSTIF